MAHSPLPWRIILDWNNMISIWSSDNRLVGEIHLHMDKSEIDYEENSKLFKKIIEEYKKEE